jgi:hypothetical protein
MRSIPVVVLVGHRTTSGSSSAQISSCGFVVKAPAATRRGEAARSPAPRDAEEVLFEILLDDRQS